MRRWTLFFLLVSLGSCTPQVRVFNQWLMGTRCTIKVYQRGGEALANECFQTIQSFESLTSTQKVDSELSTLNEGKLKSPSKQLKEILTLSLKLHHETEGSFNPFIGELTELWNFSGLAPRLPSTQEIEKALKNCTFEAPFTLEALLEFKEKLRWRFDLGAVGKGFISDQLKEICQQQEAAVLINLGGNIQTIGNKPDGTPWLISVQAPHGMGNGILGQLSLDGEWALSTSADTQRFFYESGKKYHHILNPKTGRPAEAGVRSVTVVTQGSCAEADAFSTALYVMGIKKGIQWLSHRKELAAIWVTEDKQIFISQSLLKNFQPSEEWVIQSF